MFLQKNCILELQVVVSDLYSVNMHMGESFSGLLRILRLTFSRKGDYIAFLFYFQSVLRHLTI